ncbi:tripartite tricarboxylate transporter substrate binding protein [Priestia megaterium]|nr:tripartite tricarboxylate transporter substrate binding protein [Priestia megaterium]
MKRMLLFVCVTILMTSCSFSEKGDDKDIEPAQVELVAPGAVGGGADVTARAVQQVLQEETIIKAPIKVVNKTEGQGEAGWKYIRQRNEHGVIAGNSSLLITNHLLGRSQLTYEDFTPLAILATEWQVIVVPQQSAIQNIKQLMTVLKTNDHSFKIGLSPRLGNDDHLSFVQASKAAGLNPAKLEFFVYGSSHEVIQALIENEIDVAPMSVSEAKEQYLKGKIRILGVSSPKRLEGLEEIPTWKEQGINLTFSHWRGLMGPPDMTKEEVDYWNSSIYQMVHTKSWKELLKENDFYPFYKNSSAAKVFLEQQSKMYEQLMNGSK